MKKSFFSNVLISLLFSSSALLAMNEIDCEKYEYTSKKYTDNYSSNVKEINPHLYIGQKSPDLYLVMERIDTSVPGSRLNFWKDYITREDDNHKKYKKEWSNNRLPQGKGFPRFPSERDNLNGAVQSFADMLHYHSSNNELWVAYSSTKPLTRADEIHFDNIEMVVSVMTDKEAPMITHMGITRSFHYLLKALENHSLDESENKFKVHPSHSMDLHSFSAKVMKIRDENKIYMITAPLPKMGEIMLKELPDHVYVGDTLKFAKDSYNKLKRDLD